MQKSKDFIRTRFTADVLQDAVDTIDKLPSNEDEHLRYSGLSVEHDDDSQWQYDDPAEFYADYRKYKKTANMNIYKGVYTLRLYAREYDSTIIVSANHRANIEDVFNVFEASRETCALPPPEPEPSISPSPVEPTIFIGHGGNSQWRELKDHLVDKQGYRVEAFETGARTGHVIRDILDDMVNKSSFAVLVLTAEDEQANGELRARQNVIHEAGIFQGRLGFARAIMLIEAGVEEFSNAQGVQYVRFSKDNIKETYGEVIATLRREFG